MNWQIELESGAFDGGAVEVLSVVGHETIGALFSFDLMVSRAVDADAGTPSEDEWLGAPAALVFSEGEERIAIHGVLTRIDVLDHIARVTG